MNKIFIDCSPAIGDWQYRGEFEDPDGDSDGKWSVGKIFPWGAICIADISEDVPEDEREEIAKLITAAPDLLIACEEFVRKVECGEARSKRSYKQMKDAIKKAKK